jgi:ribonuclease P protein component
MAAVEFKVAARDNRNSFASARRLKGPAEFAALLSAPREQSIRAARQMLSINAAWKLAEGARDSAASVRFGVTVGKRNARRSVDRALVRRIVREACRQHAVAFDCCAVNASVRIDVVLRLKSPLIDAHGEPLAMRKWRRQIRTEAHALLQNVLIQAAERLGAGSVN